VHEIEPYYRWLKYYDSSEDEQSPFFGKEYNFDLYTDAIYNYYIDPAWDFMGSETLYIKILYVNYDLGLCILEFIGEWNDAINNDIMHLKRNIIDHFNHYGIHKYILVGDHIFNFHGSDDCYYEEWYEDVEEGWIAAINFRDFILREWEIYNIDSYLIFGGTLQIENWRTYNPVQLFEKVEHLISRRIALS
jgi:hypothetical protein